MLVLPNFIYMFNAIPITISVSCFVDIYKLILKFIWRGKKHRIASTILKEKPKVRRLTLPDYKSISYCNCLGERIDE